jgi:hypothetical protein
MARCNSAPAGLGLIQTANRVLPPWAIDASKMEPVRSHRLSIELPTPEPVRSRSRLSREWLVGIPRVWRLDRVLSRAKRRSASALVRAGGAMIQGSPKDLDEASTKLFVDADEKRGVLEWLAEEKTSSLSADRQDYALASRWARPLVILRGLAGRAVLRDRIRKTRRELSTACRALAAHAFESNVPALKEDVPAELRNEVVTTLVQIVDASRERDEILAPFGGRLLPRAFHWVAQEVVLFVSITSWELKNRFLPRLPALAGLVAGWWIPRTFTHSRTPGIFRLLGFGHGGKHYLPAGTFRTLSFWLPLFASILCAYLAGRLGAFIRSRYAPAPAPQAPVSPVPTATARRAGDA